MYELSGSDQWPERILSDPHRAGMARFYFSMKFILARKDRMTQIFLENGDVKAGTVLKTGPNTVTQVKTPEIDGYSAVQVGFEDQKASRLSKPVLGHLKGKSFKVLKEFRVDNPGDYTVGSEIGIDTLAVGDGVQVSGNTKGHGFTGGVKRYGFKGGRRSHGQKHSEHEVGSIGGGGRAGGRVIKGMRMGGRMGNERVMIENLKVLHVDAAKGEIIISGAVPGAKGTLIEVISA
jgi:large subunit ribosomal protein L3